MGEIRSLNDGLPEGRRLYADGQFWSVYEARSTAYDRRSATDLIFESDTIVRRLQRFPANWRDLSDDELYHLTDSIDNRRD